MRKAATTGRLGTPAPARAVMYYARKAEPRSSKLLYERELAERHKRHKDRLRRMKASVDNKAPKRFVHLERNLKKEQMQEGETAASWLTHVLPFEALGLPLAAVGAPRSLA